MDKDKIIEEQAMLIEEKDKLIEELKWHLKMLRDLKRKETINIREGNVQINNTDNNDITGS